MLMLGKDNRLGDSEKITNSVQIQCVSWQHLHPIIELLQLLEILDGSFIHFVVRVGLGGV